MENDSNAQERQKLAEINSKPLMQRLGIYTKMSGPGWLQGAITLGGGSLAGAMYLGVFIGYNMMWLQPLAMVIGVIMLSAIAYVTLTTGERPFDAIKNHVSPVLAWAWLIATLMANIVWCMPQFALGTAAVQQNILGLENAGMGSTVVICIVLLGVAFAVNFFYESGAKGIALFELILKILVAVVVVSFFGVVGALTFGGALDWGAVFAGMVPNPSLLSNPAPTFTEHIAATGSFAEFWTEKITSDQLDIMMTAFGTAVGINMTFLLPYSMLRKKWGEEHRPLAIYDLSIGLIVPFVLATGCVVIAAASQFHTKTGDVLAADGTVFPAMAKDFHSVLDARLANEHGEAWKTMSDEDKTAARNNAPAADRNLAAMLTKRNNFQLANALEPLVGSKIAQLVFGVGVLGMALSTIIILMLINGFTFSAMVGSLDSRAMHLTGCAISGLAGFLGPIWVWQNAGPKLAIPTSIIGGSLIPIAYFTFLLLMNSKKTLGDKLPSGKSRIIWNVLMFLATGLATAGVMKVLSNKAKSDAPFGLGLSNGDVATGGIWTLIILFVVGTIGFIMNQRKSA